MTKKIKLIKLDDEYAILEIGPHVVYVKAEEGGIVCDVFADDIAESPTVSCWAEYAEMEDEDVEFDPTTGPEGFADPCCDVCGKPITNLSIDHYTDDAVCAGGDGPGFNLHEKCWPHGKSIEERRAIYEIGRAKHEGNK